MVVAKAQAPGFCLDTTGWAAALHAVPECIMPLPVARVTPGAIAIRPKGLPAFGGNGHMVTSLGLVNGVARTVEAHSTASGVIIGYFDGNRGFQIGGRPPGLAGFDQPPATQTIKQGVSMDWKIYYHPQSTKPHPLYWCVDGAGHVLAYNLPYRGGAGAWMKNGVVVGKGTPGAEQVVLNGPCTGFAPSPTGNGYALVTSVGSIYAFGDAGRSGDPAGDPKT